MKNLINYCTIAIIICIAVKIIFWFNVRKKKFRLLYKSFIRYYSKYDMHEAPNTSVVTFWQASNFINIIFWISSAILIIALFFIVTDINT